MNLLAGVTEEALILENHMVRVGYPQGPYALLVSRAIMGGAQVPIVLATAAAPAVGFWGRLLCKGHPAFVIFWWIFSGLLLWFIGKEVGDKMDENDVEGASTAAAEKIWEDVICDTRFPNKDAREAGAQLLINGIKEKNYSAAKERELCQGLIADLQRNIANEADPLKKAAGQEVANYVSTHWSS